jgi:hypothetical protein
MLWSLVHGVASRIVSDQVHSKQVTEFAYEARNNFSGTVLVNSKLLMHVKILNFVNVWDKRDRLCGLMVRVLGYRSGGPGSIPGTTRKKKWVWNGVH